MADRIDIGAIRRPQIIRAAMRVIAERGLPGASLSAVEREAGISRGMLTHHFPTKESLVRGVFDAAIEQLRGDADDPETPRGLGRIERTIARYLSARADDGRIDCLHHAFLAEASHRPELRARLADHYAEMRAEVAEDLRAEVDRRGLPPREVGPLAALVVGALRGLGMQVGLDPLAVPAGPPTGALIALVDHALDDEDARRLDDDR